MTLRELRDKLNDLRDDQLDAPATFVGESKVGVIQSLWTLKEDYVNPSGEGCEPISTYQGDNLPEGETEDDYDLTVVYPKDTVLLTID